MQIEHITLGGDTAIRDTAIIEPQTIEFFRPFQIRIGAVSLPVTNSGIKATITAAEEGAMFNIQSGEQIAYMNVCCFEEKHTNSLLHSVKELHKTMKFGESRLPVLSTWIY